MKKPTETVIAPDAATPTGTPATPVEATQEPNPPPAASMLPPAEGGSYQVDDTTGERTLIHRTQPAVPRGTPTPKEKT